jgi:hypothetical protein
VRLAVSALPDAYDGWYVCLKQLSMIEINEANIHQAMLKTYEHLKRHKDEGWRTGKALALVDGWKNVYHLTRGSEEIVLEFDLRKTISFDPDHAGSSLDAGDCILLTMMSMGLATDAAEDVVKQIKKQESTDDFWDRTLTVLKRWFTQ